MTLWKSYYLARDLKDALQALSDLDGNVRLIAGGTDLLLDLQQGRCPPVDVLVDITQVPELCSLEVRQGSLFIGAAVPLNQLIGSELVQEHATALWQACCLIGGPQVRNMATLGGNVAHALPAGDGSIALLALDATAEVATVNGSRLVPMAELYLGPRKTSLAVGKEILVGFYLSLRKPGEGSAFRRVMRPQGVALPIVNLAVWLCSEGNFLEDVRIATGPAGNVPYRAVEAEQALKGQKLCDTSVQNAGRLLEEHARYRTSPHRACAAYRKYLSNILLKEAIYSAWEYAVHGFHA